MKISVYLGMTPGQFVCGENWWRRAILPQDKPSADNLWTVTIPQLIYQTNAAGRHHHLPFTATLKNAWAPVSFEIDIGSAVTLINES